MSDIFFPSLQLNRPLGNDSSSSSPMKGMRVFKIAKKIESDYQPKQVSQRILPGPTAFKFQASPLKLNKEKVFNNNQNEIDFNTLVPFESTIPPIPVENKTLIKAPANIFKDTAAQIFTFHDSSVGPIYKDQQIVKHSIVGQVEWFNNAENRLKPKERMLDLDQLKKNGGRRSSRKSLVDISLSQAKTKKKKKGTQNEQLEKFLNTKELVLFINDIEKKIKDNRFMEEDQLQRKNFMKKQALTRDSKVLEKHQKVEGLWSDFILSSSTKLNRDPQDSQMLEVYNFRKKQEYIISNSFLNENFEKKKLDIYEVNVKNDTLEPNGQNATPLLIFNEVQTNSQGQLVKKNKLEIIRKTNFHSDDDNQQTNSSMLRILNESQDNHFKSFTSQEYIKNKFEYYNQAAQKIHAIKGKIDLQPEHLVVKGQSQFQREAEVVLKERFAFFKKIEENKKEKKFRKEEILESNYDNKRYHERYD